MTGKKDDSRKIRMELIDPNFERNLGLALTYGAYKYKDNNWMGVENGKTRYMGAIKRHLNAIQRGESVDLESGLRHSTLLAANVMFYMHFEGSEISDERIKGLINQWAEENK